MVNLEKYRLNGRSNGIVIFRQSKNRLAFSPPTPTAQSLPNATLKLNLLSQMVWQARAGHKKVIAPLSAKQQKQTSRLDDFWLDMLTLPKTYLQAQSNRLLNLPIKMDNSTSLSRLSHHPKALNLYDEPINPSTNATISQKPAIMQVAMHI